MHKVSRIHPRSKHWHRLDLIIFRRAALENVLHTRSYHSADCNTDHSLVCCKIRLQPKRFHCTKKQGNPRIDVSKMSQPNLMSQFAEAFVREFGAAQPKYSATEKWQILRDTMHRTSLDAFGRKTSKTHDWFDTKSTEMRPVIEARRTALIVYKQSPSESNPQILRAARSKVQQTARRCANEYWTQLSQDIQTAAITVNTRGMYDGIKKALGPTQSKTAPLKSSSGEIITDKGQQMERWVEHYSDLYSRENTVSPAALDAIECLPTMDELDSEPLVEELSKYIDSLASGKAPGNDGIPPDLIKHYKTTLLLPLHESPLPVLARRSCTTGHGGLQDHYPIQEQGHCRQSICSGHTDAPPKAGGAYLPGVTMWLPCWTVNNRPDLLPSTVTREVQRTAYMPLYIAFIDLTKAFDLISRDGLFNFLPTIGCPPKLQSMIESFHTDTKGTVQFYGSSSKPFEIRSGAKQGCVLAPTLFGIFFGLLLKHAFNTTTEGIYLRTRSDGRLFNLARLRAKTKVREVITRDILFADDAAVVAHTQEELQ